jgi:hypothetical protein
MELRRLKAALLGAVVATGSGCLAAAGAGLGAGIYLSDRGAESLVAAPIDRTFTAAQEVFADMNLTGIRTSGERSEAGEERQLDGKRGDTNVKVTLRAEGDGTRVEVVASEDMVVWDKDLAREVLQQIVTKTR